MEDVPSPRTVETALISAGQRRVNIIWERTQQVIALSVVGVTLAVAAYRSIVQSGSGSDPATAGVAFVFLASVSNLVIGFYFGRTNHQRTGGVGSDEMNGR